MAGTAKSDAMEALADFGRLIEVEKKDIFN